jgi:hypothetical protein
MLSPPSRLARGTRKGRRVARLLAAGPGGVLHCAGDAVEEHRVPRQVLWLPTVESLDHEEREGDPHQSPESKM